MRSGPTVTPAIVIATLIVLSALGAYFALVGYLKAHPQDLSLLERRITVTAGGELTVLLPRTEEQKGRGLAGTSELPPDSALLLKAMDGDTRISMLGMRYGLDLVWLDAECMVVHVVEGAQPGILHRPVHTSPVEAVSVLEMAAGIAAHHGLTKNGSRFDCSSLD